MSLAGIRAEVQRDYVRALLERVRYVLDQGRLETASLLDERPVHPYISPGRHGAHDAGHECPVACIGLDVGRTSERILGLAGDARQPGVLCVRAFQPAAVQDGHQDTVAVARLRRHARIGRRVARDLLWLRGGTGTAGTDIEDVVRRGHPRAERLVDGGAHLLYGPGLLIGEPEESDASQVVFMFDWRARHDAHDALDVGVTDQEMAFLVEIVNLIALFPVGWPGGRAFQLIQDQSDLRLKTRSRLVIVNWHGRGLFRI